MKDLDVSVIRVKNVLFPEQGNQEQNQHGERDQQQKPRRKKLPQFTAAILANLGSIAAGVVNAWASPTLLKLRDPETAVGGRPITTDEESWVSSIAFLGAFVTVPLYSHINQRWGRKITGYLASLPLIAGWLFIIFADSILYLLIGRFLVGVGGCGVSVFVSMYCGEIAEDSVRGALGTFRTMFANFGVMYVYGAGPYVSIQIMGVLGIILPIAFIVGLVFMPESPLFLMSKEREEEAMKSLLWLCGGNKEAAREEMEKLKIVVTEFTSNASKKVSLRDLLSFRGTRRALLITFVLAVIQQFSGVFVVISFCASIFEMAGTDLSPHTSSLIVSLMMFVGSLFASFLTDLAGRRIAIIVAQIIMFLTLGGLGTYFYLQETGFDVTILGLLPVICLSVCCIAMIVGLPTLAFVVVAEIFIPEARGVAMLTLNVVIWFLAFLITKFYPILLNIIHSYGCFWLFAAVGLFGALYVYFEVPETKNRSLESILREMNGETQTGDPRKTSIFRIHNKGSFTLN